MGGSILSHDHFQGGRFEFAMDRARRLWTEERGDLEISILHWPLAVIRLSGPDDAVIRMATDILVAWREHSDPDFNIQAFTDEVPHNTITPIARRTEGRLRLDLVLRNNRTTPAHPDGLFHPHAQIHPIKKENIGLIEVMGLWRSCPAASSTNSRRWRTPCQKVGIRPVTRRSRPDAGGTPVGGRTRCRSVDAHAACSWCLLRARSRALQGVRRRSGHRHRAFLEMLH